MLGPVHRVHGWGTDVGLQVGQQAASHLSHRVAALQGPALAPLARWATSLDERLQVRIDHEADPTVCRFGAAPGVDSFLLRTPRLAVETLAAGIVTTLWRLARQEPRPRAVTVRRAAPASTAEHKRLLGPVLLFDQPDPAVVQATSVLVAGCSRSLGQA